MRPGTPRSTRADTLVPYTTLIRSSPACATQGGTAASKTAYHYLPAPAGRTPAQTSPEYAKRLRRPPTTPRPTSHKARPRSEEHTSELQSLMRISYAVFCLIKKIHITSTNKQSP